MKTTFILLFFIFQIFFSYDMMAWTDCRNFTMAVTHTDKRGKKVFSTSKICKGESFYLKNASVRCDDGTPASNPADGHYSAWIGGMSLLLNGSPQIPVSQWPVHGVVEVSYGSAIASGPHTLYVHWTPGSSCPLPFECPTINQYTDQTSFTIMTPTEPVVSDVTICENHAVSITPSGPANVNFYWSESPTGPIIHTGTSFSPPPLTATKTYYVRAFNSQCEGPVSPVTVNIIPGPPTSPGYASLICPGTCLIIGTEYSSSNNYYWHPGGQTTNTIYVCPTDESTYTLTTTDPNTGCSSTDVYQVSILGPFSAMFNLSNTDYGTYYTVSATTSTPVPTGTTVTWSVEVLDNNFVPVPGSQSTNAYGTTHPEPGLFSNPPLTFYGYDYPSSLGGPTPSDGKFYHGTKYLFTRTLNHSCLESPLVSQFMQAFRLGGSGEAELVEINPEMLNREGLQVYPNPGNGIFNFLISEGQLNKVEVLDPTGRIVHIEAGEGLNQLDISTLPAGIYFLNCFTDSGNQMKKILKK